ncbi:MAG TPA: hypothetical protein VGB77_04225 [Abditibacteriaceae bacterium]|jgi:TolB-like protein
MKKLLLPALLLCAVAAQAAKPIAPAEDASQGTTATELAALKARPLPAPNTVKVAILPFWDGTGKADRQRTAAAAIALMFQREGFQVLPVTESFKAVEADKQIEPGQPLRKEDAIRIAATQGADWVVYGELKELVAYKKQSFFKASKNVRAGARYAVADVASKELLYWKNDQVKAGGTGWGAGSHSSGAKLERSGLAALSIVILQPFFEALPPHTTTGKTPDSGDIAAFIGKTWPAAAK